MSKLLLLSRGWVEMLVKRKGATVPVDAFIMQGIGSLPHLP
ncbi:MAG: hypothetical protein ABIR84_13315 [Candidatus Nitrotoga sp.]